MGFTAFLSLLGLGLLLGLKHALDADHVVAVSTIVTETKSLKKSVLAGLWWGMGHTTTLLLIGLVLLLFKISIPIPFALSFEFLVGLMLVILGANVIRKIRTDKIHMHVHEHGELKHIHLHSHKKSSEHHHSHRSFVIGLVHGLAGSAGLMLLILTTVQSVFWGLVTILIFGIGSIMGMLMVSGIIAMPFLMTKEMPIFYRGIKLTTGMISIVLGVGLMVKTGQIFINF